MRRKVALINWLVGVSLVLIVVCCAISTSDAHENELPTTRLQARISTESKSFDLVEDEQQQQNVTSSTTSTRKPKIKRKSSRRLSNIWSMFLPNSSESANATDDYEDSELSSDSAVAPVESPSAQRQLNETASNDEKLVAKLLARPQGDSMMMMQSTSSTVSSTSEQPVQLVTGSLTAPAMSDIVANSSRTTGEVESSTSTTSNSSSVSSLENDDDDDDAGEEINAKTELKSNSTRSSSGQSFERWLNRINNSTTTSTSRPPASSSNSAGVKASAAWHLRTISSPGNRESNTKSVKSPPADNTPPKQLSKGFPKRATQQSPVYSNQNNLATQQQLLIENLKLKYQSHPFQQQIRQQHQQQAQLIHGIKYPAHAASTISVSTQDVGASNTSLAFGAHYIPQISTPASHSETSQVVNSTSLSSSSSSSPSNHNAGSNSTTSEDKQQQQQQNIYQSQDEILRQVTSAINFEQQQIQQQQGGLKKDASEQLIDSPGEWQLAANNNKTANNQTLDSLDKSFELLAEKVRQQQANLMQQLNNSNTPSWLRPTLLMGSGGGGATGTGSGSEADSPVVRLDGLRNGGGGGGSLEQIRELLQRHEKTKNELKSSQETMLALMKQMAQLKQQVNTSTDTPTHKHEGVAPAGVSNLGWHPLSHAQQQQQVGVPVRPSPAQQLAKNRVKFTQPSVHAHFKPQLESGQQLGLIVQEPNNELTLGGGGGETEAVDHEHQRIIGLPIALMNSGDELELSHGQLEEAARMAAEQLNAGPSPPQFARPAPKFVARLAPAQSRQQQQQQQSNLDNNIQRQSPAQVSPRLKLQQQPNSAEHQNSWAQIEKLVSLLPPEQRQQLASSALSFNEQAKNDTSGQLITALSQQQDRKKELPEVESSKPEVEDVPKQQQQQQHDRRLQQQMQQLLVVGQYGQVPRPGSEAFIQTLRPILPDLRGYSPARGMSVAATDENGPQQQLITTTTSMSPGPPLKMRELSIYRPFGFRGHHAISYQASPTVAAMFPRFVASPPPGTTPLGTSGPGPQLPLRPGILRHMTPIRATISEGQRLIAQMLPPPTLMDQQFDHGPRPFARSRFYAHAHAAYPTHTQLGHTLPIPPLRPHHLHGPMRRVASSPALINRLPAPAPGHHQLRNQHSWHSPGHKMARGVEFGQPPLHYVSRPEADEDEQQIVEYANLTPEEVSQLALMASEDADQIHHQVARSRPSRQMAARNVTSSPVMSMAITQPCIPPTRLMNSTATTTSMPYGPATSPVPTTTTPSTNITTTRTF